MQHQHMTSHLSMLQQPHQGVKERKRGGDGEDNDVASLHGLAGPIVAEMMGYECISGYI